MGKNILIGIIIILIIYVLIKTSLSPEKEVVLATNKEVEKSKPLIKTDNHKTKIEDKKFITKSMPSSNELSSFNRDSDYRMATDCGFSQDLFNEKQDFLSSQIIKDKDIEKLNDLAQQCQEWFAQLQAMPEKELKKLQYDVEKKRGLFVKLATFEHDKDVTNTARKEIYNDDLDIKSMALMYLLKFDFGFRDKVAQEMNISQIDYLTANYVNFYTLYNCYHGADCSSKGLIMEMFCELNESSCGMSYPAWLRSGEITLNLYDDMMRSFVAIDKILNSDWFAEYPLDM